MKRVLLFLAVCVIGFTQLSFDVKSRMTPPLPQPVGCPGVLQPYVDDMACSLWVDSVMEHLTLKEQVGQLFIYTLAPRTDRANRNLLHKVIKEYHVGGLLFSAGQLANQVTLTNEAQRLSKVPLLMTQDGEWGLAMRLKGTPSFPKNMALGCISDDSLIYEYGREMARQCRELGVQVNFAPVADVNVNPRNPVINVRSFGESPDNVARKVIAYSRGLEEGGVLSVCKHFPGHGDTEVDSHKALPLLAFSRERLDSVELYPFRKAIEAGVGGMMVGHLEVPVFEAQGGVPSSLSRNVVFELLTRELKFGGLIFTDALAMKGVQGSQSLCLQALKAGNDLLLVPRRIKEEVEAVMEAIRRGELTEEEIEAKCRKVLTYKYALGLRKKPYVRLSGLTNRLHSPHTDSLIHRLRMASITLLGNDRQVLPLDSAHGSLALLHTGKAERYRPLLKAWPQGVKPALFALDGQADTTKMRQLADTLQHFDRVCVLLNERRLASYQPFFRQFCPQVPVVWLCLMSGRDLQPLHEAIAQGEATVLAHSDDEDVQTQVAHILYGKAAVNGRLSASIDSLYAVGEGSTLESGARPHYRPEEYGLDPGLTRNIDEIANEGIRRGAYPGCQVVVMKQGRLMLSRAYGTTAGPGSDSLTTRHVFDLASLTKTTATLLAVMKLYDMGRLNLTDCLGDLLPWLADTDKRSITIRQLLLHESGLPPTLFFYRKAIDEKSYKGPLFKGQRDKTHSVQMAATTWGNPGFRFCEGLTSTVPTRQHTLQVTDSLWLDASFKAEYRRQLAEAKLGTRTYRYSCVGFIMLQQVVEQLSGQSLDQFVDRHFYQPMGLQRTGYLPLRRLSKSEVVPSNDDRFLRKTVLQGFVHDESAAFQGGVSGNAGLFSTAEEVALVYQMLLNGGELNGRRYLSESTCRLFTTATSKISRRGLGFDKPDVHRPSASPCAPSAPASVYGHTGFTGTCAWVDPEHKTVYVFLSNRTYPNAWNPLLSRLSIRSRIQEALCSPAPLNP